MNTNIIATITATKATMNAFNPETDDIITISTIVDKSHIERDCIKYCDNNGIIFCECIKTENSTPVKYSISSEWFIQNAEKVEKRPQGNYISRTLNITKITALIYNSYTHTAEKCVYYVDSKNEKKIQAEINKQNKGTDKKFLKILASELTTILYIMTTEKFIANATVIE